jgi:hypothetical protein
MRGDLLSGGIPKKLVCQEGKWSLEVVRQVAVERNVYRPHTQRLEGNDVILGYLKRSSQFAALAHGAVELLAEGAKERRSYEVVNGEWIQSMLAPSYVDELKRQHRAAAHRSQHIQLLEARAECVRLRHSNAKLLSRMAALEERLSTLVGVVEELKAREPVVVQAAPVAALSEPVVAPPPPEEDLDPEAAALAKLKLPKALDLVRCIEQLIGANVSAKAVPNDLKVDSGEKLYISALIDDEDRVLGAIVMDIMGAVFMGGTLLMVPEAELNSQVRSRTPSEDSMAASSEVCNALSGSINNVPDNAHVRTKYLEQLKVQDYPWLKKPREQMTLEDTFGGHILVAYR